MFMVNVHFEGDYVLEVEAENEEKAKEIALVAFDQVTGEEIVANIEATDVSDCWEDE